MTASRRIGIETSHPSLLEARIKELTRERDAARAEAARRAAQLERVIAERDNFFLAAAHDLNTPLTALKLQVQSMLSGAHKDTVDVRVRNRALAIDRQVDHMTHLVRRLLDLASMSCREVGLDVERVDLARVARDVVDRMQPQLEWARCPIRLDLAGPVLGDWDSKRLDDVVANLLANAMKYAPGSPIEVSVGICGDRAVLKVRDHGIGIADEHHERIFERFERLSASAGRPGFGLGLWIVRKIVEASGGSVSVASQLGAGALFTVELPRIEDAPP